MTLLALWGVAALGAETVEAPLERDRYERSMAVARAGMITGAIGGLVFAGGVGLMVADCEAVDTFLGSLLVCGTAGKVGLGAASGGSLALTAGAPITAMGALAAADRLAEAGVAVDRQPGEVGVALAWTGVLIPGIGLGGYIGGGMQMRENQRAAGSRAARIEPWADPRRRMAGVRGTF